MQENILEMRDICKSFPGVKALDHVSLSLGKGEVLALIGENGAGKSTLMKILAGAYGKDSGSLLLEGRELGRFSPKEALELGISVIYQELNELSELSVAENIYVGRLPKTKRGLIDYNKLFEKSLEAQRQLGIENIWPFTKMSQLKVSQKQLVEIARSFMREAKIIVLDEPTAPLTRVETANLWKCVKKFTEKGGSVILITHKIEEVFEIADRVVVLRDGKNVMNKMLSDTTKEEIITTMVGREVELENDQDRKDVGETIFQVKNLNNGFLKDISFEVHAGEIVAFYGLMGSGCDEITQCLYERKKCTVDSITLFGENITAKNPRRNLDAGIAFVPSERKTDGLLLNQSVKTNMVLSIYHKLSKKGMLDFGKEDMIARDWMAKLRVKAPGIETQVGSLSGGNQQKVVFAKMMCAEPKVLMLNEPTRGVDVGAKSEIYDIMKNFCAGGNSILMVSSEMPETMSMADRVFAVREGKIVSEFKKGQYSQVDLLKAVIGGAS